MKHAQDDTAAKAERARDEPAGPDTLAQLYDRRFYAQYGQRNPVYLRSCNLIAQEIARRFAPASMIDWGCGAGLHVAAFAQLGIKALGVDASACPKDLCAPDAEIRRADLRRPVATELLPATYDLSLCLDVMEHIDEQDSQQVLNNITSGAGLLLLSCAPPGQGGHHHVNEQPRRYWVKRLAAMGWRYQRRETGALERSFLAQRDALPLSWMYHNICVYRPG